MVMNLAALLPWRNQEIQRQVTWELQNYCPYFIGIFSRCSFLVLPFFQFCTKLCRKLK
jgi:hypothetical protein